MAYERPLPKYSEEQLLKILLCSNVDEHRICKQWPVDILTSATFLIDLSELAHPRDVRKDNFGKWKHSGSHESTFSVIFDCNGETIIEKRAPGPSNNNNIYYLRRQHMSHPSNSNFRKILVFLSGKSFHVKMQIQHIFYRS